MKAIDYFKQALSSAINIGDKRGEVNQFINLGNIYDGLGEHQKSIEYTNIDNMVSRW